MCRTCGLNSRKAVGPRWGRRAPGRWDLDNAGPKRRSRFFIPINNHPPAKEPLALAVNTLFFNDSLEANGSAARPLNNFLKRIC
ncbi:hypothetical protein CHELA40_50293 [Chelatococcus asaccharovorans]|nr:hypothetical protein CHELA17_20256 [Chelatococcus asaccharovorans]CAH1692156.1 hypothetical protein CHELA40_50293 [Chelatococcus asaccharovorans]